MSLPSEIQSMKENRYQERVFDRDYDIYQKYQSIMAGQSTITEEESQKKFEDLCTETGEHKEDLWQECEEFSEKKRIDMLIDLDNEELSRCDTVI